MLAENRASRVQVIVVTREKFLATAPSLTITLQTSRPRREPIDACFARCWTELSIQLATGESISRFAARA
jgi:hypothetical protein